MVVGVCRLSLYFAESGSLKAKRRSLRGIVDRLANKFNAAVAEVAHQDSWQRSTVGICVVANEGTHVRSMLDKIADFAEQLHLAQVLDREVDLIHYGDDERM